MSGKKIFVITGAAGFIGQKLIAALRQNISCEVRGIDIIPGPYGGCDESVCCDLRTALSQNEPLRKVLAGADTVFHLAGKVHSLSEVKGDEEEYWSINVTGSENLLEAARQNQVKRFVFFSSIKVFGEYQMVEGAHPLSEADTPVPDTPYGKTKLAFEQILQEKCGSVEPVILRLAMVYGPGAKGNMTKMIRAVQKGIPMPLPEFGNKRSMVDVRDVVKAALLAAGAENARGVYQVTDGNTYSTRQTLEYIRAALGKSARFISLPKFCFIIPARIGDGIGKLRGRRFFFDSDTLNKIAGNAWFASEKIRQELGFVPEWDLRKSLESDSSIKNKS